MTTNHCGTCTACCRVFAIAEMPKKKAGQWCEHCAIGKGCKVYDDRPETCRTFECLWLLSQGREDPREQLPPDMRPDRCKVVFSPSTDPSIMAGTVLPGANDPLKHNGVRSLIGDLTRNGMRVVVGLPAATRRTMYDRNGLHEVRMTEPDENGMQWNIPERNSAQ